MKKKLKSVLLIDDDADCNYYHQRLFKKMDCAEQVYIARDGKEAIEFLTSETGGKYPEPDIVFLDINMPIMNGWQFLEEYKKLDSAAKAKIVLVMLTTSLNPDDKAKSESYQEVSGYKNKYLSKESVIDILSSHFPENF